MHIPLKIFSSCPVQWCNYQSLGYLAIANSLSVKRPTYVIKTDAWQYIFLFGVKSLLKEIITLYFSITYLKVYLANLFE